jgi:hypothetical protein
MKILLSVLFGLVSAILLAILVGLVVGGGTTGGQISFWTFLVGWVASTVFFARASTLKRAAARACLTVGLESFALPVAGIVFSLIVSATFYPTSGTSEARAGAAMGAALGGGIVTIALGIFGFFFGLVFIVAAYFLGKTTPSPGGPLKGGTDTTLLAGNLRKCHFCAEMIRPDAIVCRYCGRDVAAAPPARQG